MNAVQTRMDFMRRDPSALGALLAQDWRTRDLVTDGELIGALVDQTATTAVLRHLQRVGFVRALHGARLKGGRMRLWPLSEVWKVQVILDLRAATGLKLCACVEALDGVRSEINRCAKDWRDQVGTEPDACALRAREAAHPAVLSGPEQLSAFARTSIARAVARCDFERAERPAFLL